MGRILVIGHPGAGKSTFAYGNVRSDMADGCPEKIDLAFLKFVWNYRRDRYPRVLERLREHFTDGELVMLKAPAESATYLSEMRSIVSAPKGFEHE